MLRIKLSMWLIWIFNWQIALNSLRIEILIYFCIKVFGVGYEGVYCEQHLATKFRFEFGYATYFK